MTQPGSPALDEPWVRAALSRSRRKGWLVLGSGLLLFILVGVAANVFAGTSDRLRESGGQTSGVIVQLRGLSTTSDTSALVHYTVDGHDYEEKVDLGNRIRHYRPRQEVTVYYDLERPTTMTIDDINNAPTWTVLPMVVAFVGGLGLMVAGAITLAGRRRRRRTLSTQSWQDAAFAGARGTDLYLTSADGALLKAWRPPKAPPLEPTPRVRTVTGRHGTLVALGDVAPELLTARSPRNDREEQAWRGVLAGPPPP